MNTELADVYTRVTNQIVEAIEKGVADWRMPWHSTGKNSFSPLNVATQKPYRGVNVLSLWAAAQQHGYPTGYWATYKQWQEMGAQVRKGEKSSLVVFWKFANVESEDEDTPPPPKHPAAWYWPVATRCSMPPRSMVLSRLRFQSDQLRSESHARRSSLPA